MRYIDGPRPRLFGHRGAAGTVPENTMASFATALAVGAERLELDAHVTSDGEVVVLHDPTLERTTDGHGSVHTQTLGDIQNLDAGCCPVDGASYRGTGLRVPTLHQVLESFPGVPLNIEVKSTVPGAAERVLGVITHHGARDQVLLAAEDSTVMASIRAAADGILTGFSAAEVMDFVVRSASSEYRPPGFALQVPARWNDQDIVTPDFVSLAHGHSIEVHVWTVNSATEIHRLLDLGVDGIITDFPAMARSVYVQRGL